MSFEAFIRDYAGKRYEYVNGQALPMGPEIIGVDGEVSVTPTKSGHGLVIGRLSVIIGAYVLKNDLGEIFGAETGFHLKKDPPLMRAADIAFVSRERLKGADLSDWMPIPDLAVEVVSEYDRAREVHQKVQHYLTAGIRLVWIVYPDERQIVVHAPDADAKTLSANDTLNGGAVLPEFAVTIGEIFAGLDALEK